MGFAWRKSRPREALRTSKPLLWPPAPDLGESFMNQALRTRRRLLEKLTADGFRLAQITPAGSAEDIEAAFVAARARSRRELHEPGVAHAPAAFGEADGGWVSPGANHARGKR